MMIKKIKEFKNIDAFDLFSWKGEDLNRLNLVYGWNGTGKTTLSRLFHSLENNKICPELGSPNFNIQTDAGSIKETDITSHSAKIKVFNEDFIRENLQFNDSKAKKILIVGKENADVSADILALEAEEKAKRSELDNASKQRNKLSDPGSILTDAGREVVKQFTNTPLGSGTYYGRTYDKRKIEPFLNDGTVTSTTLDTFIISKQEDIDRKREIIKSQKSKITFSSNEISDFSSLFSDANNLTATDIKVESIQELENDKDLRDWTETGYHLHKNRDSDSCLFCRKPLGKDYLDRLAKFFTEELQNTQKQINDTILALDIPSYKGEMGSIEAVSLFPDLSAEYLSIKSIAEDKARIIRASLDKLLKNLRDKKENLHEKGKIYPAVAYPADAIREFNEAVSKILNIVSKQNEQIDKIAEAAKDIELHTIADVLKKKDYFHKKSEVETLDAEIKRLKNDLEGLNKNIRSKKASVLNATIAVDKINTTLKEFFGESHIYLETDPNGTEVGYVLKRRGKNAKNLSQGEKSVIALIYFLTKLEESGFNKEDSLIILDDPCDSQDEMFLFKTFGLIKHHLARAGQLIILTHNFPFFNLIRDWFINENRKSNKSKELPVAEFYSICCHKNSNNHETQIEALHELLKKYKTEYQYLFYHLYSFSKGHPSIDEPLIPNVGRKILEYFAGFKWSCDVSEEFSNIVHNRFANETDDKIKANANFIVKFLNEYSHGQEFSRPVTASIFEAKSIAENIIKFIEITDKEHCEHLKSICDPVLEENTVVSEDKVFDTAQSVISM